MDKLQILLLSAAFLGFIHTLLGLDHYLPFIVLGKARKWSYPKTLWIILYRIWHKKICKKWGTFSPAQILNP